MNKECSPRLHHPTSLWSINQLWQRSSYILYGLDFCEDNATHLYTSELVLSCVGNMVVHRRHRACMYNSTPAHMSNNAIYSSTAAPICLNFWIHYANNISIHHRRASTQFVLGKPYFNSSFQFAPLDGIHNLPSCVSTTLPSTSFSA